MSFASLGLSDALVRAVTEEGYTEATPIQIKAIPAVLKGGDLLAGAQTGTGKTAGFVLPMLQRLAASAASRVSTASSPANSVHPWRSAPSRQAGASPPSDGRAEGNGNSGHRGRKPLRALILTPTRELAAQVEESVRVYGKYQPLTSMVIFGGVSIGPQTAQLKRGVDILVATPGRLLDHHGQGNLDFSHVEIFVLDEADRMLDMGFIRDIKRVLKLLPPKRQNLLFSATFSDDIRALADTLLDRPALIEVAPRNATVDVIAQKVHPVDRDRKRELLSYLIGHHDWHQVLVFTRTKHGANKLAEQLNSDGITALAIHGNKSQGARTRALAEFKQGGLQVLVATDIAARGIDIDQLPHVVNYDLPNVAEDYIHRIGRTGRAGASGEAISLVCVDEHAFLRDIERLLRREIPSEVIDGFKPDPHARAQPILQRAQRGNGSGRGHGKANAQGTHKSNGNGNGSGDQARQNGPRTHERQRVSPGGATAAAPSRIRTPSKPAIRAGSGPVPRATSTPRNQASRPANKARNNLVTPTTSTPRTQASTPAQYGQPARPSGTPAPAPYLSPAARSQRPRGR